MAVIIGNAGNNVLTGGAFDDLIFGGDGNDVLNGLAGNDYLDGGSNLAAGDSMFGGVGDDTYIVNSVADTVTENFNEGTDTVEAAVNGYTLLANFENLKLSGVANGTGNALNNGIVGNDLNNLLSGLDGDDVLEGLLGNDTLFGGNGNDTLDGGDGNDIMQGGLNNDIYTVANAGDIVIEAAGQGTDIVFASINYVLTANVENLTLTDTAANGTGNILGNILIGNTAKNTINGGDGNDDIIGNAGNDKLNGEAGNDFIKGGLGDDKINGGDGVDTLKGGFGNDSLVGGNGQDFLLGNEGNDTLAGGNDDDVLLGFGGNLNELDVMQGDGGADLFILGGSGANFYTGDGNGGFATINGYNIAFDTIGFGSSAAVTFNVVAAGLEILNGGDRIALVSGVAAVNVVLI